MTQHLPDTKQELVELFKKEAAHPLSLDISIGTPSKEQLALSDKLLEGLGDHYISEEGIVVRNYAEGRPEGIIEARRLMGELVSYPTEDVFVHGNSSLTLMHHYILHKCSERIADLKSQGIEPKMLIPVPGFYRHFMLCEGLGITPIPLYLDHSDVGIDTDDFHAYLNTKAIPWGGLEGVVGMICVPRYSNPTGHTFPWWLIDTIAELPLYNEDFHVLWDNAYVKHELYDDPSHVLHPIRESARISGTEDFNSVFCTTSKITYASAGIAGVGLSPDNFKSFKKFYNSFTIGPDRATQLNHARFFEEHGLDEHMKKYNDLMRPKFETLLASLDTYLGDSSGAVWNQPKGGFFISLYVTRASAMRVIELCSQMGLKLTPAGACFPGDDPHDNHIRIAPAAVNLEDLDAIGQTLSLSIKLATLEAEEKINAGAGLHYSHPYPVDARNIRT